MKYLVVVERGESSWGAHLPDLPGCVAAAATRDEVLSLIRDAIDLHVDALRERGQPVPEARSEVEFVDVEAA